MAQEEDIDQDEFADEQPPYLASLQSNSTTLQARFSDVSRPSDGNIQVERLMLTPAHTVGDRDDGSADDRDDEIQPASPYPAGIHHHMANSSSSMLSASFNSLQLHTEAAIDGHVRIASIPADMIAIHVLPSAINTTDLDLIRLSALSTLPLATTTTAMAGPSTSSASIASTASSPPAPHSTYMPRISTPHTHSSHNKKHAVVRKSQRNPDRHKDVSQTQQMQTPPPKQQQQQSSTHERGSSLGTIRSTAGTIGTMDNHSEYQPENVNVRPHITDKQKSMANQPPQKRTRMPTVHDEDDDDDDDARLSNDDEHRDDHSEIPPLPHGTPHRGPTAEPRLPSAATSLGANISTIATHAKSMSNVNTQVAPPSIIMHHAPELDRLNTVQSTDSMEAQDRHSRRDDKHKYMNSGRVDLDNMQFGPEVDLNADVALNNIVDGDHKSGNDRLSRLPKTQLKRSTTTESRKSVRFLPESRNTFMSPNKHELTASAEEEFPDVGDDDVATEVVVHSAPTRFRGPARIGLLHKHVTMDPFEGDTEIEQWSVGDVQIFISNLEGGVAQYANNFVAHHIKGQDLLQLTDADLLHSLEVRSIGHRQILLQAIRELKEYVIVEINMDRFLVPPNGIVLRFEDVSLQQYEYGHGYAQGLRTALGHVTGTFLPNQITAIMGDAQKSLLLKTLSGYGISSRQRVSGHIFINGNPVEGSLVHAGLATYINGDDSYCNFTRTTVADLVMFYVKLSGDQKNHHHEHLSQSQSQSQTQSQTQSHSQSQTQMPELVRLILRICAINYPRKTKISELRAIQYKRLMIAIEVILYNVKLVFLDKLLDDLTHNECVEMMQMIYSFSRKLDITFVLSVEKIRYHILNAYFDQVIVVGGVDKDKIRGDADHYFKTLKEENADETHELKHDNDDDGDAPALSDEEEEDVATRIEAERSRRQHHMTSNDLLHSATSIRFVGRPEDVMEYFRIKNVHFQPTENPIEVIYSEVVHNEALIEEYLEADWFRYRKRHSSLSPFTALNGPRTNRFREIYHISTFVLMVGWREWSLLYACLRLLAYCLIVGGIFWNVSCDRYFLNERLLAIFVIACIPVAAVWPISHFYTLHRSFWVNHMLFPNRIRLSSFLAAMLVYAATHSFIIGLFSFIPWLMEDLGANDVVAFVRIGCMQFAAAMVYALVALWGSEVFAINQLRVVSLMCTASVLFAGALVHAGHVSNRPGTILISLDFLKYSLEFLLFTDVDYIQKDAACRTYLDSLQEREYYDREGVDVLAMTIWFALLLTVWSVTLTHQLRKTVAYAAQLAVGNAWAAQHPTQCDIEVPSLPPTPPPPDVEQEAYQQHLERGRQQQHEQQSTENMAIQVPKPGHRYAPTSLTSLGQPTPVNEGMDGENVPILPLHITPVASELSHGTGAFSRFPVSASSNDLMHSSPTGMVGSARERTETSEAPPDFLFKQSSLDSTFSLSGAPLPPGTPSMMHRRAASGEKNKVTAPSPAFGPRTSPSQSSPAHGTRKSHHEPQVSLSGLETIREKKAEDELPAVPPTTSHALLLRHQTLSTASTTLPHVPMVPSPVRIFSTRTSAMSGHYPSDSRYSGLSSFTPIRQHTQSGLLGRMSFTNRRRSSLNMKSNAMPRFLAISPAQSFVNAQNKNTSFTFGNSAPSERYFGGKDSMVSSASFYANKRLLSTTASAQALHIPFDSEFDEQDLVMVSPARNRHDLLAEMNVPKLLTKLSTVPSQETVTVPRHSVTVLDDFVDADFELRMRQSPLKFFNLCIVDNKKRLLFSNVTGHAIENGVSVILAPSNIDCLPVLRAIAGIYNDNVLYMEGRILIKQRELLTEYKLTQHRIMAYVPSEPVLPDLITVQDIIRLAFILTEPDADNTQQQQQQVSNVKNILKTMELQHVKDMLVSQLSRMDYLKVAIAYCGLRSKTGVVLIEDVFSSLDMLEQNQLLRCIHRLSQQHRLSILTCVHSLSLESVTQDHINHIILLSSTVPGGVTTIYEGSIQEALHVIPKIFQFKKFENMISELLDIANKSDVQSVQKLAVLSDDLRRSNAAEEEQLNGTTYPLLLDSYKTKKKGWLEYWWLGWLYWRFVTNNKRMFMTAIFKLFVYVVVICLAFWNLPTTHSGSKSMFGAINALLFIFTMQTPANHRLFLPLLSLGIQDWQNGKYSLNMMSTLHCWAQYLLSIVLATMTSLLSYWTVNFNDPATAMGYSIVLFTMGFVYSAGVWDSIYFVLYALGCSSTASWFIMCHLLLYFWLFSGCFVLKSTMPLLLRIVGYYANPVRLTLESQYCAIMLPKTFGNERGSDILAQSDYDCAIGFDLCLVFCITFVLRLAGSFILAYKYEAVPLYNYHRAAYTHPIDVQAAVASYGQAVDIDNGDASGGGGGGGDVAMMKTRLSTDDVAGQQTNGDDTQMDLPPVNTKKRSSRHKGHASMDHIQGFTGTPKSDDHYVNMDTDEEQDEKHDAATTTANTGKRPSLIQGLKNALTKKSSSKEHQVGLLQRDDDDDIDLEDMRHDNDSDSGLLNVEHEFDVHKNGKNGSEQRIKYFADGDDGSHNYNTMVLGAGGDDSDSMNL